jgi:hypothetical protein
MSEPHAAQAQPEQGGSDRRKCFDTHGFFSRYL